MCKKNMSLADEICFGGLSAKTYSQYRLVRFIPPEYIQSTLNGDFLIGSVQRNKKFDDARSDKDETSIEFHWENKSKEQWFLSESDCQIFFHPDALNEIDSSTMTGSGNLTFKNRWVSTQNLLSLSIDISHKKGFA